MSNPGLCSLLVPVKKQRVRVGKLSFWKRTCAVFMLWAATTMAWSAETFTTMHSFTGTDGANPYVGLVQGTDGNFYGTSIDGGANGGGNVLNITPAGKLTSLYSFCSQSNCADGQYPCTVLVQGNDGNFYGTTQSGGTAGGYGTVFKITPSGKLTTLHSFNGTGDGAAPYGSLVLATNGEFYGTTNVGATVPAGATTGKVHVTTPSGKLASNVAFRVTQ